MPADRGLIRRALFVSHTSAHGIFRVGSHHLARELAKKGVDVVHLSTPVSLAHRLLGRVTSTQIDIMRHSPYRDDDGVTHIVPRALIPSGILPYDYRILSALGKGKGPFDVAYVDQPLMWGPQLSRVAGRIVYRPTDLYPSGRKAWLQTRLLMEADGVVATSELVLQSLGPLGVPMMVLPNGVEVERFHAAGPQPRRNEIVYVGALDERFDWNAVAIIADCLPNWTILIWGTGEAPRDLPSNVSLRGPVAYEELPVLLAGARIGMLPLSLDPLNEGRSPMKLHEYLASGLVVLSRETTTIRADEFAGVFTYAGIEDLPTAVAEASTATSPNTHGVERANREDWARKADQLIRFTQRIRPKGNVHG